MLHMASTYISGNLKSFASDFGLTCAIKHWLFDFLQKKKYTLLPRDNALGVLS